MMSCTGQKLLEVFSQHMVRHEQGAAHAADAVCPCHWQGGCLLCYFWPWSYHLVTGIATAQMDSIPMVIVTGRVPLAAIGTDAFSGNRHLWHYATHCQALVCSAQPQDMARIVAEASTLPALGVRDRY